MLFAYPTGMVGNVVSNGVDELINPNYKQTWASIRKIAKTPRAHPPAHLQIFRSTLRADVSVGYGLDQEA